MIPDIHFSTFDNFLLSNCSSFFRSSSALAAKFFSVNLLCALCSSNTCSIRSARSNKFLEAISTCSLRMSSYTFPSLQSPSSSTRLSGLPEPDPLESDIPDSSPSKHSASLVPDRCGHCWQHRTGGHCASDCKLRFFPLGHCALSVSISITLLSSFLVKHDFPLPHKNSEIGLRVGR